MNYALRLIHLLILIASIVFLLSGQAVQADCPDGNQNSDAIDCSGADDADAGSDAGAGKDSLTVHSGTTVDGDINGQAGHDQITTEANSTVNGVVNGDNPGRGNDNI